MMCFEFLDSFFQVLILGVLATLIAWRHLMRVEEKGYKLDKKEFDFQRECITNNNVQSLMFLKTE